ncbi:unnamed protein product [Linum tenue]|uniref:Terpene synthase metal-binding domain-containing protein n=2 Tax=Linum tenue TaxID=586396 RepID=A0AAV0PBT7_9ROSI|nr:unnamed protein product [Linum tenue]
MLVEAKWCRGGRTPSLKEYLTNGSVSSSGTVIAVHSFFSVLNSNTTRGMKGLSEKNHHHLIHNVCLIIRLCNDIGTSKVTTYYVSVLGSWLIRFRILMIFLRFRFTKPNRTILGSNRFVLYMNRVL